MRNILKIRKNRNRHRESEPLLRQRRALLFLGATGIVQLVSPFPQFSWADVSRDYYPAMADLTRLDPLEEPLLVFRDFIDDPDQEIKTRIIQDLANNPDLMKKLREKAAFKEQVSLSFDRLDIRLLYVPELRKKYAKAYRQFSENILEFVLERTQLSNPYQRIVCPHEKLPEIPQEATTAFIVHQLGKEYRAVCTFTGAGGHSAKYRIKGAIFSSHLGAVDLVIESPEEGVYCLKRKNYSIWQNRTKNLYTLLTIPIEETLHYIIGHYTDRKIEDELKRKKLRTVSEVQKLANHWMAVEEAMVGGLVHTLLRDFANKYAIELSPSEMEDDYKQKKRIARYRFRQTGIALTEKLGYQEGLNVYKKDPEDFSRLLVQV